MAHHTTPICAGCGDSPSTGTPPLIHIEAGPATCFTLCTSCAVPFAAYVLNEALDADARYCEQHHAPDPDPAETAEIRHLNNVYRLAPHTPTAGPEKDRG